MKNRLHLISPKLKMILSALLLLLSLYFLWSSAYFTMPTQILAIKKAEAEHCLPPGTWELYRPSLDYKSGNAGGWYFSRRGDAFYIVEPYQNDTPLWDDTIGPYRMAPLSPYAFAFNPIWGGSREDFSFTGSENMVLVTTPDPNVARMELALGDQTAECTESAPGSGFWVGIMRTTDEDNLNEILVRAYDADGVLIGSTPD